MHALWLDLTPSEGILVRVLGLTERRGYRPVAVVAEPRGEELHLRLTVESERPIGQLLRQLGKLFDVRQVRLAEAQPTPMALEGAR